ncbi:MAG: hypothetical protein AB7P02_22440 [Alphaproteobacteria bacterium]
MNGEAPIFVHAGLPKAGSTTLQRNLFPALDGVRYLGAKGSRQASATIRTAAEMVVNTVKFRARDIVEAADLPAALAAAAGIVASHPDPVLLSDEGFSSNGTIAAYDRVPLIPIALRRLFGDRVRVMLVLRDPAHFVASLLLQRLSRQPLSERGPTGIAATTPTDAIELHFRAAEQGDPRSLFISACRYDLIVQGYRDAFGPASCHLVAFEHLFGPALAYRTYFSRVMGIPPAQVVIPRINETGDSKRREAAYRLLGASATPSGVDAFATAWREAAAVVRSHDRLSQFLDRHCRVPYAEALAAAAPASA